MLFRSNYVVALTGDHGVPPIPEQLAALGIDAGRLDSATVRLAAQQALEAAFGPGSYTVRSQYADQILEPAVVEKLRQNPVALEQVLRALRSVPGVAGAYFGEHLDLHAAAGDYDARAALRSYYPGRSGDLVVVPKPYWFYVFADGTAQPGLATSHGSMYAYDQHVPLILFGAGIGPGEYLRTVTPADIAPTLAHLCGITLARIDGEVLIEALSPAADPPPPPARSAGAPKR